MQYSLEHLFQPDKHYRHIISPAKLQNAAASIDRIGEEGRVLRTTFVISLLITAVCAAMSFLWAF